MGTGKNVRTNKWMNGKSKRILWFRCSYESLCLCFRLNWILYKNRMVQIVESLLTKSEQTIPFVNVRFFGCFWCLCVCCLPNVMMASINNDGNYYNNNKSATQTKTKIANKISMLMYAYIQLWFIAMCHVSFHCVIIIII